MRVSKICTDEEIALEHQRELLRDRRWARRGRMIGLAGRWLAILVLALRTDLHSVLKQVLSLF